MKKIMHFKNQKPFNLFIQHPSFPHRSILIPTSRARSTLPQSSSIKHFLMGYNNMSRILLKILAQNYVPLFFPNHPGGKAHSTEIIALKNNDIPRLKEKEF